MTDEKLGHDLEEWMKDAEFAPPDSRHSARQVATRLPQTRQLGRWWWLPSYRRSQTPPPTTDQTTDYQPSPIPAPNGHTPTVIGRTQSMFSPAKAITAGALVFALGGVLLIAQPFDQQRGTAPGAATDAEFVAPVEVTGDGPTNRQVNCSQTRQDGDETTLSGSDDQWTCTTSWTFSDDRLSGRLTTTRENVWLVGNGLESAEALSALCAADADCEVPHLETVHSAMSLENDGGAWRQRPAVMFFLPDSNFANAEGFIVMDGEEGYEGLVAVLEATGEDKDTSYYGFILDARQLKPAPENASTK